MLELYNASMRAQKREFFDGRKYTPLYEKGIKKTQNKSMETTHCKCLKSYHCILNDEKSPDTLPGWQSKICNAAYTFQGDLFYAEWSSNTFVWKT